MAQGLPKRLPLQGPQSVICPYFVVAEGGYLAE
jgi:hypothetical protein